MTPVNSRIPVQAFGVALETDGPIRSPHHGPLYVRTRCGTGRTVVGTYTEHRFEDGATLRLFSFGEGPVYAHHSRRRTRGVQVQ
jgi:hypothetical protein